MMGGKNAERGNGVSEWGNAKVGRATCSVRQGDSMAAVCKQPGGFDAEIILVRRVSDH